MLLKIEFLFFENLELTDLIHPSKINYIEAIQVDEEPCPKHLPFRACQGYICCVFQTVNWCFACHLLVKIIVSLLNKFSHLFPHKRKKRKCAINNEKYMLEDPFLFVFFLYFFCFFFFVSVCDEKRWENLFKP